MKVSGRFIASWLFFSIGLAFAAGRAARLFLIEGPRQALLQEAEKAHEKWSRHEPTIPSLVTMDGKKVPHTRYLSKNFDTGRSTTISSWLATNRVAPSIETEHSQVSSVEMNKSETCASYEQEVGASDEIESSEPAGEHLMVDINNVDGSFLNSEPRLAQAIVDLVHEADLPLLSYHCHGFNPVGVRYVKRAYK